MLHVIITSYPTRANGIIVLVNSQTGFCCRFLFPQVYVRKENLATYFPYDVKLGLLAHSRSFIANQKARNAIVGAENLLIITDVQYIILSPYLRKNLASCKVKLQYQVPSHKSKLLVGHCLLIQCNQKITAQTKKEHSYSET